MSGIGNYMAKYYGDTAGYEGADLDGNLWGYTNLSNLGGGSVLACYETTSFTGLKTLFMATGGDGVELWSKALYVPGLSPFKVSDCRPLGGKMRVGWTEVKSGYIEMAVGEVSAAGTLAANVITLHAQTDNSTNRSIGRNVCLSRYKVGFVGNNRVHLATLGTTIVPSSSLTLSGNLGSGGALVGVSDGGVIVDASGYVVNMSGPVTGQTTYKFAGTGTTTPSHVFPTPDGGMIVVFQATQAYLVKLTRTGTIQWQRKFDQNFILTRLQPVADGTILVAGSVSSYRYIARLSQLGVVLWSRKRTGQAYINNSSAICDGGTDLISMWNGENADHDVVIVKSPRDGATSTCEYFNADGGLTCTTTTSCTLPAVGTVDVTAESAPHAASAAVLTEVTQNSKTIFCFNPEVVPEPPPQFWPPATGGDDADDYGEAWGGNPATPYPPGGPGLPGDAADPSVKDTAFFVLEEYGSNPGVIGGWTCWRGLPGRFGVWSPEQNRIELLGDGRAAFLPQRGRAYTNAEILFGFTHLSGESLAITAVLHFSLEFTGDGASLAVDFEVDGEWVNTVEKDTDPPEWYFAKSVATGVAVWSTDPADGCWVKPISQVKRFYAIGKNRGRLTRVRVRHEDQGSFRPQRAMITFAVRNLR